MTALGRMRALGEIGTVFYLVKLMPGMDPKAWAASDPALKLNLSFVKSASYGDVHMFACPADPATAKQLLMQDPRVVALDLVGAEEEAPIAVEREPSYVDSTAPGTPQLQNAGYVPKLPNDPTKSLSVVDAAMAALPAGAASTVRYDSQAEALVGETVKRVPWWAWLAGAYFLLRR